MFIIILLLASLLGAVAFVVLDLARGPDFGALVVGGIAGLIAMPAAVLYFRYFTVQIRRYICLAGAGLFAVATGVLGYVSVWSMTHMPDAWLEERWLFIVALFLFGSAAAFLLLQFFVRRNSAS